MADAVSLECSRAVCIVPDSTGAIATASAPTLAASAASEFIGHTGTNIKQRHADAAFPVYGDAARSRTEDEKKGSGGVPAESSPKP